MKIIAKIHSSLKRDNRDLKVLPPAEELNKQVGSCWGAWGDCVCLKRKTFFNLFTFHKNELPSGGKCKNKTKNNV